MENFTMLQFFEWYSPGDGSLWEHLKNESGRLKSIGIDAVWLPPAQQRRGRWDILLVTMFMIFTTLANLIKKVQYVPNTVQSSN
jgi:hypothetical protein